MRQASHAVVESGHKNLAAEIYAQPCILGVFLTVNGYLSWAYPKPPPHSLARAF